MQHVLRTLVIAAFAVFGMNACAPAEKTPPTTAAAVPGSAEFAPAVDSSKLIYVTPVEGINSFVRLVLADAIAAALRDAKKPAVLSEKPNDMGPTVSGRIVEVQERDSVYWVTAVWALKARYGTPVSEYRSQIVVDKKLWETGAPEAINLLVADASPMIAGMVRDFVSPVAMAAKSPLAQPAAKKAAGAPPVAAVASDAGQSVAGSSVAVPAPEKPDTAASAPASNQVSTKAPAKAPSLRPKRIPRRPAHAPATSAVRNPEPAVETAALTSAPDTAAPAEKSSPPTAEQPGRPKLLTRGPPRPQPKEKPVGDAAAHQPAKPVLMPVPDEAPSVAPDPPPVVWTKPSFLIKAVEGAPGDGNVSLLRAMKAALRKRDLTVTEDPRQAGFVIHGRVQVGPPVNGRQQAKIVWAVNTVSGEEVGKAVQENAVKAGSLDGPWGRIAEIVSAAAVTGIQELFGFDERQSSRADLPPVPPIPNLPRVPGRAPPPPR